MPTPNGSPPPIPPFRGGFRITTCGPVILETSPPTPDTPPRAAQMLPRVLEPEVMDTAEEARDYDAMDHSAVNGVFARNFLRVWDTETPILDLGTGTAQLPVELCRQCRAEAPPWGPLRWDSLHIVAVDLAERMLELARRNVGRAGFADRIRVE